MTTDGSARDKVASDRTKPITALPGKSPQTFGRQRFPTRYVLLLAILLAQLISLPTSPPSLLSQSRIDLLADSKRRLILAQNNDAFWLNDETSCFVRSMRMGWRDHFMWRSVCVIPNAR